MTTNNEILPRSGVEEMSGEDEKGVEPSTSLIHRFGDEVGRERRFEFLLIFEWVMYLSVGHAVRRLMIRRLYETRRKRMTDLPDSNQQSKTSSTR